MQAEISIALIERARSVLRRAAPLAAMLLATTLVHAQGIPPLPQLPDLNDNQLSMARAIPVVCSNLRATYPSGTLTSDQVLLFDACAGVIRAESGADSRSIALQELTGEELNASHSQAIDFGGMQQANILSRLMTLRQASGSSAVASLAPPDRSVLAFSTGGAAGDGEGSALDGRLGLFLNGRFGSGSKDTTDLEAGYDVDITGLTFGADYRLSDQAVLGAAFSYGSSDSDFDNNDRGLSGGSFDTDGYSLALFGSWYGERSYVDVIASYGQMNHDSTRRISYTLDFNTPGFNCPDPTLGQCLTETWDDTATGSTDSDAFSIGASYGYNFGDGPWTLGPLLAINYLDLSIDGFTEKGAPGLNLTYGDQDGESLQLQAGFDVARASSMSWGVLSPYARFVYVNEQKNDQQVFDLRYSADPLATPVAVRSDEPDRNFFRWGVGLSALFANGVSAFMDYDSVLSLDTVDYWEITAGLRYEFR
jgi:uncharacterized protein YhjY with autotransporter beta-barrel domain